MTTTTYAIWLCTMALGFWGALLIFYSVVASWAGENWGPLERSGPFISALLTLLGTFVTAGSIYVVSPSPHEPFQGNLFLVSPIVMVGCLVAALALLKKRELSPTLVNGFALLAIAGGLQRMIPGPVIGWLTKP